MKALLRALKDLVTTKHDYFDPIRVSLFGSVVVILFLAIWHVIANHTFDPMSLAGGIAALLAGGGVGIGAKATDEPEAPE